MAGTIGKTRSMLCRKRCCCSKKAKYVLLSLPSPNIVAETVAGKEGLLCHLQTGGFLLDLSTTDVQTTLAMEKAAAAKGIHYLDCPVSGVLLEPMPER